MAEHENEQHERDRRVRIHIDQHQYESPNPTSGAALYILGNVQVGLELYREVTGDKEDREIENGPETVHLKEDDHFHSGQPKIYTIVVNGRMRDVASKTLSFDQLITLAFNPVPVGSGVMFTITYRKGPHKNPEGSLTEGMTVKIKDGMIFDVSPTNRS